MEEFKIYCNNKRGKMRKARLWIVDDGFKEKFSDFIRLLDIQGEQDVYEKGIEWKGVIDFRVIPSFPRAVKAFKEIQKQPPDIIFVDIGLETKDQDQTVNKNDLPADWNFYGGTEWTKQNEHGLVLADMWADMWTTFPGLSSIWLGVYSWYVTRQNRALSRILSRILSYSHRQPLVPNIRFINLRTDFIMSHIREKGVLMLHNYLTGLAFANTESKLILGSARTFERYMERLIRVLNKQEGPEGLFKLDDDETDPPWPGVFLLPYVLDAMAPDSIGDHTRARMINTIQGIKNTVSAFIRMYEEQTDSKGVKPFTPFIGKSMGGTLLQNVLLQKDHPMGEYFHLYDEVGEKLDRFKSSDKITQALNNLATVVEDRIFMTDDLLWTLSFSFAVFLLSSHLGERYENQTRDFKNKKTNLMTILNLLKGELKEGIFNTDAWRIEFGSDSVDANNRFERFARLVTEDILLPTGNKIRGDDVIRTFMDQRGMGKYSHIYRFGCGTIYWAAIFVRSYISRIKGLWKKNNGEVKEIGDNQCSHNVRNHVKFPFSWLTDVIGVLLRHSDTEKRPEMVIRRHNRDNRCFLEFYVPVAKDRLEGLKGIYKNILAGNIEGGDIIAINRIIPYAGMWIRMQDNTRLVFSTSLDIEEDDFFDLKKGSDKKGVSYTYIYIVMQFREYK